MEKTRKCPFCAETIKAEAIVCRYCGRDLPKDGVIKSPTESKQPGIAGRTSSIAIQSAKISGVLTALAILGWVLKYPSSTELIGTILFSTIPTFITWWAVSASGIWLYRKYGAPGCAIAVLIIIGLSFFGNALLNSDSFGIFSDPSPTATNTPIATNTPRPEANCILPQAVTIRDEGKRVCITDYANWQTILDVNNEYVEVYTWLHSSKFYVTFTGNPPPPVDPTLLLFLQNSQELKCIKVIGKVKIDKEGIPFIDFRDPDSFRLGC